MPDIDNQSAGLDRGNPAQAADAGKEAAGSFLTDLTQSAGSGATPASQDGARDGKIGDGRESAEQTVQLPGYAAGLSKELKADKDVLTYTGKFKSMDDLVKSAMAAESKLGGMVSIPDDKASPELVAEFYRKLGVPDKPEEYKFEDDDRVKSDPEQVSAFKQLAKELNLTQKQAQKLWKDANDYASKALADSQGLGEQAKDNVTKALQKEWGNDYAKNVAAVQRGLAIYPNQKELIKEANAMGYGNAKEFVKVFQFLGSLFKEDSGPDRRNIGSANKMQGEINRPGL